MTAACTCCDGTGWTPADTYFACDVEHPVFDFDGLLLAECLHCHDRDQLVPLRTPYASQLDADLHVAGQWFAMRAVGVHFNTDGVHKGERRQQAALARLTETVDIVNGFERVAA